MALRNIQDPKEYLAILHGDAGEIQQLFQDFLIRVTQFFRDPEALEALKDKNAHVRRQASVALIALGSKATEFTPALLKLLKEKDAADTRQLAAFVLGNIGPEPQQVVNDLRQAFQRDESDLVKKAAGEALKKISPDAATAAGVP